MWLRFVRWHKKNIYYRVYYCPLLRQDPSEYSAQNSDFGILQTEDRLRTETSQIFITQPQVVPSLHGLTSTYVNIQGDPFKVWSSPCSSLLQFSILQSLAGFFATDFQFCFMNSGVCLALHEFPITMAQPGNTLKAVSQSSYRADLISRELLNSPYCLMPSILFQILCVLSADVCVLMF